MMCVPGGRRGVLGWDLDVLPAPCSFLWIGMDEVGGVGVLLDKVSVTLDLIGWVQ